MCKTACACAGLLLELTLCSALQSRPSVQELLCMPYVSQYIQRYAELVMQLPADNDHAPSLNLDQLPLIKQIRRYAAGDLYSHVALVCLLWNIPAQMQYVKQSGQGCRSAGCTLGASCCQTCT